MIQRVQSLYLFLTTIISFLFLNGSILSFINKTGSVIKITLTSILRDTEGQGTETIEKVLPLTIILILVASVAMVTIFLFKNRNIQLWFSRILIGLVSGLILVLCYYSYLIISEYECKIVPGIKMTLPFILLILSVLAYRGIRKDDNLVKSYDRLR